MHMLRLGQSHKSASKQQDKHVKCHPPIFTPPRVLPVQVCGRHHHIDRGVCGDGDMTVVPEIGGNGGVCDLTQMYTSVLATSVTCMCQHTCLWMCRVKVLFLFQSGVIVVVR